MNDSDLSGWLLHCVEAIDKRDDAVSQDVEYPKIVATVTECESYDTLRTQIPVLADAFVKLDPPAPRSILESDSVDEKRQQLDEDCQEAIAPVIVHDDSMANPGLSETPDTALSGGSANATLDATQMRDLSAEDELSRSKMDYFEADEDDMDSEENVRSRSVGDLQPAAPGLRLVGVSEFQCARPSAESENGISKHSETVQGSDSEGDHNGFGTIDEAAPDTASFQSSSSEWEDCVSEARQSSDSVDTIQQPPSLSDYVDAAERPGSPKRLGTPTAGILGLHESRWADFGIRGALTGSHAFGRPSTAPMPSAEQDHEEEAEPRSDKADEDGEETPRPRPATPHRKSLHLLHHKKSISSIIFPGTHHGHQLHQHGKPPRLSKKESKELRAREKWKGKENGKPGGVDVPKDQHTGDAGRFPRAMMLITGLAIASSVVNRSSA
ncbi:putative pt repeat family protein [Diaporthe ampelina]|uniref:Putative pt repeat family protein n=1 Tax=Diaporthe ampelina TaxID=1214573 RepID=A0A0G2HIF3_9PEZI|nr:putative pt repeat family protein [Diaporthe ampelina]